MGCATQYSCFVLVDKIGDKKRQTAYKPGSVHSCTYEHRTRTTIPLGRALLRASRDQPERRGGNAPASRVRSRPSTPPATPIRSCSRWGLPCRPCCQGRGALLPHRFTLASWSRDEPAVCFLWHFPWGRPRRPLTGTVFPWSPDFPPPWPGHQWNRRRGQGSGRPAVWQEGNARRRRPGQAIAAATCCSRARVAASASPVMAPGSQCRWNARSATARSPSP